MKEREKVIPEHHLARYRAADGALVWDVLVPPGPWVRTDFRSGPGGGYAAPTPCTDGKLVFCGFGSSVYAAVDLEGKIAWRKEIIPASFDVTVASSPVLHAGAVIILCAMAKPADSRVIALEAATGEVRWERKFPDMAFGHTTPTIIDVNGKPQMLVLASGMSVSGAALRSLDPGSGEMLWWCRGAGDVPCPAHGSGLVYFDSGRGGPGFAVDPTGSGDVSATHVRWKIDQVPEGLGSPIFVDGRVYRLHSPDVLKCWDAATGKTVYARRLEGIGSTWSSPIADRRGRIFFAAGGGKSYVVAAGPEFRVLGTGDLGDPNHTSPAAAGGKLFLLGTKELWCIGRRG